MPDETADVFGRPDGVSGSFAQPHQSRLRQPVIAPPDPVLREAFGRPDGAVESLERDPHALPLRDQTPAREPDPWRDPESLAGLDGPAVTVSPAPAPQIPAAKLGIRELFFDRFVSWRALAVLAVVAIAIGALGGVIGRVTAEVSPPLHSSDVTLPAGSSKRDSAKTQVEAVAAAVEKAVVAVTVRTAGAAEAGSGVVLDRNGYIVTNNHVISLMTTQKATVEVTFADRTRVPARLVGRDVRTDLAVLKVDNVENLTVAALGDSDKLEIGEEVVAFGSPLGLDRTVTSGIVSATHRAVPLRPDDTSDTDAVLDAIQTDAAINPGNSGGPLVDSKGKVIGVNTARRGGDGTYGLGFAIPINEARDIAGQLIRSGKASHAQIGVNASSVRNDKVLGAQVRNVRAGSPGAQAGLREGDVVTEFDKRPVDGADELSVAVRTADAGKAVPLQYWRDGRIFSTTITPALDS